MYVYLKKCVHVRNFSRLAKHCFFLHECHLCLIKVCINSHDHYINTSYDTKLNDRPIRNPSVEQPDYHKLLVLHCHHSCSWVGAVQMVWLIKSVVIELS